MDCLTLLMSQARIAVSKGVSLEYYLLKLVPTEVTKAAGERG